MRFPSAVLLAVTLLCGCSHKQHENLSIFHDNGSKKPHLTVFPIYNQTQKALPWSALEHFSDVIATRLLGKSTLVVSRDETKHEIASHIKHVDNVFSDDFTVSKAMSQKQEFVAFIELVEHEIHERSESRTFFEKITPACTLEMSIRVKVIDVRSTTPKVVLQEIIHQSHLVPKSFAKISLHEQFWAKKTYSLSPIGIAHTQVCKEVANRIEEYILLSKAR